MLNTKGTSFGKLEKVRRRLVMALDGLEKNGKTHFALTAPGPVCVMNFDIGLEGVAQKFEVDGKEIVKANYEFEPGTNLEATAQAANKVWAQMNKDYEWAVQNSRTVIMDTASEGWELLRIARFGKLTQVMPHHYGPVNNEWRKFIRLAYEHDANLILIHKLKPAYETKMSNGKEVSNKIPGTFKRAGMSDTGFLVQLNAIVWRGDSGNPPESVDEGYRNVVYNPVHGFNLMVRDCRQNAELSGQIFSDALMSFPFLASQVFPDTTEEDWQ